MELFIQIKDGKPHDHPIFGDNFRAAFPHIDVDNLPPEFAKFVRVEKPLFAPNDFKVVEDVPTYEWCDGVVQDVWHVRDMTDEEKRASIAAATEGAAQFLAFSREQAALGLAAQTTDAGRAAWQDYVDLLATYEISDVFNPVLPGPPRFDENGNPMSLSAPGSAPNVIG